MGRTLVVLLSLVLTACGTPAPTIWGQVVERDRENVTLLTADGLMRLALTNRNHMVGDCIKVEVPSVQTQRVRQVDRETAASGQQTGHCPTREFDEIFGYLSCNDEICTFSSPQFPGVRAEPLFVAAAEAEFKEAAGLPNEARMSEAWPYCVRLRGLLGREGRFGHLGGNNRILYVFAVDAARNVPDTSWCERDLIERAPPAHGHRPIRPFYD